MWSLFTPTRLADGLGRRVPLAWNAMVRVGGDAPRNLVPPFPQDAGFGDVVGGG